MPSRSRHINHTFIVESSNDYNFCRAMLCLSATYAVARCLSVCLCILLKRINIFNIFSPPASHTSPSFSVPNVMAIFRRGPPNDDVECRWGRQKSRSSTSIWLHRVSSTVWPPSIIHAAALDRGKLVTLIAGKWRRLFFARDDDEVFVTRSVNVTIRQRQQNRI